MKKLFRLVILLYILFIYNNTNALNVSYPNPVGGDMIYKPAIFGPQASDYAVRIYANTQAATQFCLQNGGTYVSHTGQSVPAAQYLYFGSSWIKTTINNIATEIVCDIPEPEIQTIIDSDPGINKPIFDEDTIRAIYLIEVIIIFFFFFFRFFSRLLE